MTNAVPAKWVDLQSSLGAPEFTSVVGLGISLVVGGGLAVYIRFLYRRSSPHTSADSIARVFPLLTLVTIAVIAVVKSSLALSLGLVGALSIVRFRAAIKDPEELVYLFLCIGVGLALGAQQAWLAFVLVLVATLFVLVFDRLRPGAHTGDAFLTIVGDSERYFGDSSSSALEVVRELCPRLTVERCDIEGDQGQLRLAIHRVPDGDASRLVGELRSRLSDCRISYVNARALQ